MNIQKCMVVSTGTAGVNAPAGSLDTRKTESFGGYKKKLKKALKTLTVLYPEDKKLLKENLKIGTKVEAEHHTDMKTRIKTAKDHLKEQKDYYTAPKPKDWAKKEIDMENNKIAKSKRYEYIDVHRGGKTFKQKRLVGSDKDNSNKFDKKKYADLLKKYRKTLSEQEIKKVYKWYENDFELKHDLEQIIFDRKLNINYLYLNDNRKNLTKLENDSIFAQSILMTSEEMEDRIIKPFQNNDKRQNMEKAFDKNKLVKKVVTDKNGHRVTKWVKMQSNEPVKPNPQLEKRAKERVEKHEKQNSLESQYNEIKKIAGVKQNVAEILLAYLGSIDEIKKVALKTPEKLTRYPKISDKLANKIHDNLKNNIKKSFYSSEFSGITKDFKGSDIKAMIIAKSEKLDTLKENLKERLESMQEKLKELGIETNEFNRVQWEIMEKLTNENEKKLASINNDCSYFYNSVKEEKQSIKKLYPMFDDNKLYKLNINQIESLNDLPEIDLSKYVQPERS